MGGTAMPVNHPIAEGAAMVNTLISWISSALNTPFIESVSAQVTFASKSASDNLAVFRGLCRCPNATNQSLDGAAGGLLSARTVLVTGSPWRQRNASLVRASRVSPVGHSPLQRPWLAQAWPASDSLRR